MKAKPMNEQEVNAQQLTAVPDRSFYVLSAQSGKALTVDDRGEVVLSALNHQKNQVWKFEFVQKTEYHLICEATKKALDVVALGTENGTPVHQWEALGSDSQTWSVEPWGDIQKNECQILSKLSGRALDIVGLSQEDGAHLQLWDNLHGENQLWCLQEAETPAEKKPAAKKTAASGKKTSSTAAKKKTATKKSTAKSTSKSTKAAAKTTTSAKTASAAEKKA